MRKLVLVLFGVAVLSLGACSTVTVTKDSDSKLRSAPSHVKRQHYYWWGLSPKQINIDVEQICKSLGSKGVQQMQSQFTFADGVLSLITLGIYNPKTVRIWCE